MSDLNQPELTEWAKSHAHHNPHPSEIEAAEKAFFRAGTLKKKIYDLLFVAGDTGMTPEEICDVIGYNTFAGENTVRRRITDLQKAGRIRHHPELITRANRAGNKVLVWIVGSDPDNQKTKIQILQERIKELKADLRNERARNDFLQTYLETRPKENQK